MVAEVCVVILCGLPASGKTSFCVALKENWRLSWKDQYPHILHVCFDDLIPSDLKLKFNNKISSNELTDSENLLCARTWKQYRREILTCFEKLLISLKTDSTFLGEILESTDKSSGEMWKKMRDSLITGHKGCSCLVDFQTKNFDDNKTKPHLTSDLPWEKNIPHVFIIDDNMFYRSMRYEYYQVTRKYSFGFSQVYLQCPLEVVEVRNSLRERQEKDKTLVDMSKQMEEPKPDLFLWERHSISIDTSTCIFTEMNRDLVNDLIRNALADPPQPIPEEDLEEKEASRQACAESTIHQADQILRKFISKVMEQNKGEITRKKDLQNLGRELNQFRKELLDHLRSLGLERLKSTLGRCYLLNGEIICKTCGSKTETRQSDVKECSCNQLDANFICNGENICGKSSNFSSDSVTTSQTPECISMQEPASISSIPSYFVNALTEFRTKSVETEQNTCVDENTCKTLSNKDALEKTIQDTFIAFCADKTCNFS